MGWVKSHIGIPCNEAADTQAKAATEVGEEQMGLSFPTLATEGGLKQWMVGVRKSEREAIGFGQGKKIGWGRKAFTNYIQERAT